MSERFIDIRTELAASSQTRVEIGRDGVLHVLAGPVTLHLDRAICEELTTTLARAMIALARSEPRRRRAPKLRLVRDSAREPVDGAASETAASETTSGEPTSTPL